MFPSKCKTKAYLYKWHPRKGKRRKRSKRRTRITWHDVRAGGCEETPEIPGECRLRKSGCFTNATECQKSSTRNNRKKKGREKKYSKKWKYGSYPVALANAIALAATVGHLGDFAEVFQTRSRDQVQWPVAVKKRSRTGAALLAVIDDAYVRAFIKYSRFCAPALPDPFKGLGKDFWTVENTRGIAERSVVMYVKAAYIERDQSPTKSESIFSQAECDWSISFF